MSEELPDWLDKELWDEFVAQRNESKHPLTERAARANLRKLARLKEQGYDPNLCLDEAIAGDWRGIHPVESARMKAKPQCHQDYKPEPEQEYDEEKARENIEWIQERLGNVVKISGDR